MTRARGLIVGDPARIDVGVGAVLGAGLRPDGRPTAILANRVRAAAVLYHRGSVDRLLMSGAVAATGDQPAAMATLAEHLGVPAARIELDRTGVDTAATCRSLLAAVGEEPTVLVTQRFHAARTAYLASKAGLAATVFVAPTDHVRSSVLVKAWWREVPASVKAIAIDRFSGPA